MYGIFLVKYNQWKYGKPTLFNRTKFKVVQLKKHTAIPFLEIQSIPLLIKDFLSGAIPGFEEHRFSVENFEKQFAQHSSFSAEKRAVLFSVLMEQHSQWNLSRKQRENLDLIQNENTFTVTTGHQLNLFTGPVFFIYKILQTIKLSEYLNVKFPDQKVVPIFWMASEDHDFEEINHFKTEKNFYEIHSKSGGAVGRIEIADQFFIQQFAEEFKDYVFGTELILLLKKAYKQGNTLAQATRFLVQQLFAEYGILIVDGDHPKLKMSMHDVFQEELLHQKLIETTKNTIGFLSDRYGKVQVNPREINLFYLSETRNRIEFSNGKFHVIDTALSFEKEEILAQLKNHPELFSPNALLRPVYQQEILPNIAYIGGNAEIMYWLELKDYFQHLSLPFPILIPRNSLLFIPEKTLNAMGKMHLSIEDFFKDFAQVSKEVLLKDNAILSYLNETESAISTNFQELEKTAAHTDITFGNLVDAEKTRQLKSFERMKKRLLRAEKIKQSEHLERLENLFLRVHPGKVWQERIYNFSVFYADFGAAWLQTCYQAIDVEKSELLVCTV